MQPSRTPASPLSPVVSPTLEPGHARAITESHERSRAFGLREHEAPAFALLSRADLQLARQRNSRLCEQAMPVMEILWEQIAHTQSMVVLTDAHVTVLHALVNAGFLERAHRVALAPGAVWSELHRGTNAVGTALIEEQPTLVHAREHYLSSNHFLTCSAAPIFDHAGHVLGVIDVSGDHRSYHPHTLALARMSARLIENQWFSDRFRGGLKLHLHASPQGLGTVQEGIVAIDTDGRILGANRCALDTLGRSAARLRHESLESIFGVSLPQMVDHARLSGDSPMTLVLEGDSPPAALPRSVSDAPVWAGEPGQMASAQRPVRLPQGERQVVCARLSGDAIGPGPVAITAPPAERRPDPIQMPAPLAVTTNPKPPPAASSTLREQEIEAIAQAIRAAAGNMARAARALGIGRSTLYRKLRGISDKPKED